MYIINTDNVDTKDNFDYDSVNNFNPTFGLAHFNTSPPQYLSTINNSSATTTTTTNTTRTTTTTTTSSSSTITSESVESNLQVVPNNIKYSNLRFIPKSNYLCDGDVLNHENHDLNSVGDHLSSSSSSSSSYILSLSADPRLHTLFTKNHCNDNEENGNGDDGGDGGLCIDINSIENHNNINYTDIHSNIQFVNDIQQQNRLITDVSSSSSFTKHEVNSADDVNVSFRNAHHLPITITNNHHHHHHHNDEQQNNFQSLYYENDTLLQISTNDKQNTNENIQQIHNNKYVECNNMDIIKLITTPVFANDSNSMINDYNSIDDINNNNNNNNNDDDVGNNQFIYDTNQQHQDYEIINSAIALASSSSSSSSYDNRNNMVVFSNNDNNNGMYLQQMNTLSGYDPKQNDYIMVENTDNTIIEEHPKHHLSSLNHIHNQQPQHQKLDCTMFHLLSAVNNLTDDLSPYLLNENNKSNDDMEMITTSPLTTPTTTTTTSTIINNNKSTITTSDSTLMNNSEFILSTNQSTTNENQNQITNDSDEYVDINDMEFVCNKNNKKSDNLLDTSSSSSSSSSSSTSHGKNEENCLMRRSQRRLKKTTDNLMILDKQVPTRAWATVPSSYVYIRKLDDHLNVCSVYAKKEIPPETKFGPIEGDLQMINQDELYHYLRSETINDRPKLIINNDKKLDTSNEYTSNWMSFVRVATNFIEQNLLLWESDGKLYFKSCQLIKPKEELKVGYSYEYAIRYNLLYFVPNENEKSHVYNKENTWNCYECNEQFNDSNSLQLHLNEHDNNNNKIDINHKNNNNNNEDNNQTTMAASDRQLKINRLMCNKNRRKKSNCIRLTTRKVSGPTVRYACCYCNKIFVKYNSYKRHIDFMHSTLAILRNDSMEKSIKRTTTSKHDGFKCMLCPKYFATVERLMKHRSVHCSTLDARPHHCTHCTKRFLSSSALATHAKMHIYHHRYLLCPFCDERFSQSSDMLMHVQTHMVNGKYTCQHCDRKYTEYTSVRKHIRTKHGKKFICNDCTKEFSALYLLKKHQLCHSEIRAFTCDTCGKRFKRKDKVFEHIKRMHSIERSIKQSQKKKKKRKIKFDKPVSNIPVIQSNDIILETNQLNNQLDQQIIAKNHVCETNDFEYTDNFLQESIVNDVRTAANDEQIETNNCIDISINETTVNIPEYIENNSNNNINDDNYNTNYNDNAILNDEMYLPEENSEQLNIPQIQNTTSTTTTTATTTTTTTTTNTDYYNCFIFKCKDCKLGFKRRGMLVNHLAKCHPNVIIDTVPELNLPILKEQRFFYCQHCNKVYKSNAKRKAHILKHHPGAELPLSLRIVHKHLSSNAIQSMTPIESSDNSTSQTTTTTTATTTPTTPPIHPNPNDLDLNLTYSHIIGNITTEPYRCSLCYKQYASKTRLKLHERQAHYTSSAPDLKEKLKAQQKLNKLPSLDNYHRNKYSNHINNTNATNNDNDNLFQIPTLSTVTSTSSSSSITIPLTSSSTSSGAFMITNDNEFSFMNDKHFDNDIEKNFTIDDSLECRDECLNDINNDDLLNDVNGIDQYHHPHHHHDHLHHHHHNHDEQPQHHQYHIRSLESSSLICNEQFNNINETIVLPKLFDKIDYIYNK